MARRHRSRPRTRRETGSSRHTDTPRRDHEVPAATSAPVRREAHRPARYARAGYSRALGTPSQSLERAAVAERGFVVKDFRRLGLVVAIALALLIVSGVLESVLLR